MGAGLVLSWRDGVVAEARSDGLFVVQFAGGRLEFRRVALGILDALSRLTSPGEDEDRLVEIAREGGQGVASRWFYYIERLHRKALLCQSIYADGKRLAVLSPGSRFIIGNSAPLDPRRRYQLSRFAYLARPKEEAVLESPLANSRIVIHDERAAAIVGALMTNAMSVDSSEHIGKLPSGGVAALFSLLLRSGTLEEVDADGNCVGSEDSSLQTWEFHDLLFHTRSRLGRFDAPRGGTYRLAGRIDPPPALKATPTGEVIDLFRPDMELLERADPPLARVQERRRSASDFDAEEPITSQQLGEFLSRVARVKESWQSQVTTDAGSIQMEFASRPYPSGGSLYELEFYTAINCCEGLQDGLYYYDALRHQLIRLCRSTPDVQRLLRDASESTAIPIDNVQVLVILAARFPRLAWKYESIAYSLVLKHVGVVFQTMYLAATAMNLGSRAVGCGDADCFARAAGTDYYAETSVGEFLVGSQRRGPMGTGRVV